MGTVKSGENLILQKNPPTGLYTDTPQKKGGVKD